MKPILQNDLTPALTLLREGLGKNKLICRPNGADLEILCSCERAFFLHLVLRNVSPPPYPDGIWEDFSIREKELSVITSDGEHHLRHSGICCRITLRNYVAAPVTYAPYHYLRDTITGILKALEEKHRILPWLLTEEEQRFLPLCSLSLFCREPLPAVAGELLAAYGITVLPLKEDRCALTLLRALQRMCALEEATDSAQNLLRDTFGASRFSFPPSKRPLSIGLSSFFPRPNPLYCYLRAVSAEDRVVMECALTPEDCIDSPAECAVESTKAQCFWVFSIPAEEFNQQNLLRFREQLPNPKVFPCLQLRPKLNVAAVFVLSALLWAAVSSGAASFLASCFPALSPLVPWAPLPSLIYGAVRGLIYAVSEKL